MNPTSPFEITRRNPAGNVSATYAAAALRGFALGPHPTDPTAFVPAGPGGTNGTGFIGHLTRAVVVGGLTLADRVFGRTTPTPDGLAGPFTAGGEVTVEKAQGLEAEDPYLLLSGTGAISGTVSVGTKLSFFSGLLRQAQSGDQVYYVLTANNLPVSDSANTLRIRAEAV